MSLRSPSVCRAAWCQSGRGVSWRIPRYPEMHPPAEPSVPHGETFTQPVLSRRALLTTHPALAGEMDGYGWDLAEAQSWRPGLPGGSA